MTFPRYRDGRPLPVYDSQVTLSLREALWLALTRYGELLYVLAGRDIQARYKGSILGLYWAIISPLATALVFTVVFSLVVRVETPGVAYPLFALTGLAFWGFLTNSVTSATNSLVVYRNVLTKIHFPRELLVFAAVLARTMDLLVSLILVLVFMAVFGMPVSPTLLLIPPVGVLLFVFVVGVSLILSAANVFFRDVQQLLTIGLTLWMFLTPVFYPAEQIPERYRLLFALNPMLGFVDSARRLILDGRLPDPQTFGPAAIVAVVVFLLGYWFFKRLEPQFAEIA